MARPLSSQDRNVEFNPHVRDLILWSSSLAWSIVAHSRAGGNSGGTSTSPQTTPGVTSTGSDLIVVGCTDTGMAITDSKSNTPYTLVATANFNSGQAINIFECRNPIVGASHTVTATWADGNPGALAAVFLSGSLTSGDPLDQQHAAMNNFIHVLAPGSITPSQAAEIIVTFIMSTGQNETVVLIDGGFTIIDAFANTNSAIQDVASAYLIQTSAAASNPTWTVAPADQTTMAAAQASFKAGAAAATQVPYNPWRQRAPLQAM